MFSTLRKCPTSPLKLATRAANQLRQVYADAATAHPAAQGWDGAGRRVTLTPYAMDPSDHHSPACR